MNYILVTEATVFGLILWWSFLAVTGLRESGRVGKISQPSAFSASFPERSEAAFWHR